MTLACIERVLVNVAVRQIAAPRCGFALTEVKVISNRYFTACHSRASSVLLIVCGHSLLHYLYIANVNVVGIYIEFAATGTKCGDDPAPVGVAACKCTLPERGDRNCAAGFDCIGVIARTAYMHGHQLRRSFAIASHLACQVLCHAAQRLTKRPSLRMPGIEGGSAPQPVGKEDEGIVWGHMSIQCR